MIKTKVIPILTGTAQAFLIIQGEKFGLVDSGNRNTDKKVLKAITSRGLKVKDLAFIFLTHTHFDHAGNAAALKKSSGAPIIVHQSEAGFLQNGFHPIPNGSSPLSNFIVWLGRRIANKQFSAFKAVESDIVFNNDFDLKPFGFNAQIIQTPGHTCGSSTLLIENKAFVGDTVFNMYGIKYPLFVNNQLQLLESWRFLISMDVEYYYPAHGKRITKLELKKALQKHSRKLNRVV